MVGTTAPWRYGLEDFVRSFLFVFFFSIYIGSLCLLQDNQYFFVEFLVFDCAIIGI
ncbi:uncharacterized protein DS421_17g570820 [Arachis hypogaea]|nr:uncharacterized protein DS421_17g570820 [Arachis hypogaea]